MAMVEIESDLGRHGRWTWHNGTHDGDVFQFDWRDGSRPSATVAVSAPFPLDAGGLSIIEVACDVEGARSVYLELFEAGTERRPIGKRVARRECVAGPGARLIVAHSPSRRADFRLTLNLAFDAHHVHADRTTVGGLRAIRHRPASEGVGPAASGAPPDTHLPHWSRLERWVHDRCKRSRTVNGLVAALEVRIGREEVLSLPQFLALCPTGQCNATCAFCSVTTLRTGIIKRQMPLEAIRTFTAPARKVVRMYGIEGNGEPMLYRDFPGLAEQVLADGALAYLITNASQFTPAMLPLLLAFDSINISLNAATAATHRRVMGLKGFDDICTNIRALTRLRGLRGAQPHVSVSFVVTHDNVGEAAAFLQLAEDLGVDRALLRPLSELGNDLGAVEDGRDLVPYQSDIADLLEAVTEHIEATKATRRSTVFFEPETFKAVRPDPPIHAVLPVDRPDTVPLPRSRDWQATGANAHGIDSAGNDGTGQEAVTWSGPARLRARRPLGVGDGAFLRSALVPVPPGRVLGIELSVSGAQRAGFEVRVLDHAGRVLGAAHPRANSPDQPELLRVECAEAPVLGIAVELRSRGIAPLDVEIDLGRVRKPATLVDPHPAVPPPARWEHASPAAEISWAGEVQSIRWSGAPGPYLAKSYSRECLPGTAMAYPVAVEIAAGRLGIGVLSEDAARFVRTFEFDAGRHETTLDFDTGPNRRLQLVVYSVAEGPLDASIDWGRAMMQRELTTSDLPHLAALADRASKTAARAAKADPVAIKLQRREAQRQAIAEVAVGAPPGAAPLPSPGDEAATTVAPQGGRGGMLRRLLRDDRTIHCHKPWTDLANFSVDGRVDVCCIATGASQKRFELGNLNTQSFQDVWNGPRAKEFRRTVNDPNAALPPCQRCPMSKAYQGAFLDPGYSCFQVWRRTKPYLFGRSRLGRQLHRAAFTAVYGPIHLWLFRGYKRAERFPFAELDRWYDG